MEDHITIKNISLFGYHGILPEEKERGQEFLVSVVLQLDLQNISTRDEIEDTVDYTEALSKIQDIFTEKKYDLMETLAEKIAAALLKFDKVTGVKVTVEKPRPPLPVITGGVSATVYRTAVN